MAENEWPKSILFVADGWQQNFGSADELNRWAAEERTAWNALAGGGGQGNQWASVMLQNMNLLEPLLRDQSPSTLQRIANEYRPSKGALGKFVARIQNPQTRWATFSELVKPGATGAQQGGDFVQARALATFYQAIGSNLVAIEQASDIAHSIRVAIDDVNRLREADQTLVDRFNKLMSDCDAEWKKKIEGFETKAALSAPRTYWNARSERHNSLAADDRRAWRWSVWALVAVILVVSIINFSFPPPLRDVGSEITSTVQRLIFFGSLLAVAVWWLRQKLRDVRMHEHFAEDAAERATMIETYAAMRGEGLQDKDFSVILAALYRPAAGNLADDTGPVLPTEAIWRAMGEIASRQK